MLNLLFELTTYRQPFGEVEATTEMLRSIHRNAT